MIVGVTGSVGFLGWHLRCRLFTLGLPYLEADRAMFADPNLLDEFVSSVDVVVHAAGVNRAPSDAEVSEGNVSIARAIADARKRTGARFDTVFANSVKAAGVGAYGESKAAAAEILEASARDVGDRFVDVHFPHLFGEFGRPHYNSSVTTFAYQLSRNEPSTVNQGELELLHVQDASQVILDAITKHLDEPLRPKGRRITVPETYALMSRLSQYVSRGTIPFIADDGFELRLFNTIRSQMWPDAYPMQLTKHADDRGAFFEVVRSWGQGQTSISTTVPGVVRGEHYHLDKVERFSVISGSATIRVRRLFSRQIYEYEVTGDNPVFIDMPTLCTHDITNTGDDTLVTLFWSHDHFDPAKADTYPLKVVGEELPA